MISVKDEGVLLTKTENRFESQAVCNPSCIESGGVLHMFYRAIAPGNFSSIGYCILGERGVAYRAERPVIFPEYKFESHGVEDPRVVRLDGVYYLFYVAYDGFNALTAYATSSDLVSWKKQGLISPSLTYDMVKPYFKGLKMQGKYAELNEFHMDNAGGGKLLWQKDAYIFPKRIQGKIAMLYRILPGIQIVFFEKFSDLTESYWHAYFSTFGSSVVLDPLYPFESRYIGGGAPPVETADGWLLINQGVEQRGERVVYHCTAALLDLNNPHVVLARLPYPLFSPKYEWEKHGQVQDVVFPSSALIRGDRLFIYHGAADTCVGAKSVDMSELLAELKKYPVSQ